MEPNRRFVLTGLASLAACADPTTSTTSLVPAPAPDRAPEPAPWGGSAAEDLGAFAWGVLAGDITADRALVVVRTLEPEVVLTVVVEDGDGWAPFGEPVALVPVDGVVQHTIDGLAADTAYRYQFTSADGARGSAIGRLRAAIDAPRKVVFGASSCFGGDNPQYPSIAFAAADALDFFVLLGDSVYADGAVSVEDYRDEWRAWTAKANIRALTASTTLVATWDDHEINNNWFVSDEADGDAVTVEQVANGTAMFHEALPMAPRVGEPLWRSLVWGDVVELIVMDCRGERDHVDHIVSDEQLAWAIDRIRASPARFKVVLVSVHVTDHSSAVGAIEADDRWQGYPAQREALVAAAAETPGVLFVTGDMHYGGVQRVAPAGAVGADLYEVAAGPSGSSLFPIVDLAAMMPDGLPAQYEDVVQGWTWARFELDPGLGEVRVQLIDDDGVAVVDRVLRV